MLHVDDDPDFAEMIGTFLEREDGRISVERATSASEGLDRLEESDIDCVVSDHEMPGMNGIEFLEVVREEYDDLPFILFTGKGSEDVASDAISAGVTDYLQKQSGTEQYELLANRVTNVVSQHHAQELAAETEQRLQELTETTNDILWMFTADWSELLFINSAYEDIWGLSMDTLAEHPTDFLNGVHTDDREQIQEAMDRLSNGHTVDFEIRVNPDEEYQRWVWIQGAPITDEDGTVSRVAGFVRDITEQKKREQELENQYEQFRYVEDVADVGYWELDVATSDTPELAASQGVYEIYEYTDDEPLDVEDALAYYHPEDRPKIETAVERVISEGEPYDLELRLTTVAGNDCWVHTVGEPVEENGEVVTVRGIIQDITERKRQEQALRAQNERLDEFASVVSHDLRNPLRVAEGNLELAREDCSSDQLDRVERALDRMDALISDLLTLAREGDRVNETEAVDLAELSESCWGTAETANATVRTSTDRTIYADRSRLAQLLENLFRDAVEHGSEDVTVSIGELESGFYVEDDGPGIPEDRRDDIFDAGYSTSEEGTGFGLSIVKQVADAHGWTIRLTDGTDGGARFEITGVEFAQ